MIDETSAVPIHRCPEVLILSNRRSTPASFHPMLAKAATFLIAFVVVLTTGCSLGNLNLTGAPNPTASVLSLAATTLNFGSIVVGAASAAQTLTVSNTGTAALTISNISITGDFAQTNSGCTASIAVNGTCTISIIFTPTATGARTGILTLTSNGTGSPQTVSLSGTGTAPGLVLSATMLNFGSVALGSSSAAQTVTVTNVGTTSLTVSSIAITGDYSDTTSGCVATIAGNGACTISVTFTPTATGVRRGTLTLTSNGSGSPQTISLGGTGTAPILGLSPASLTFNNVNVGAPSAAQIVMISNTGSAPLTVSNIAITGDYSDTNMGCSATLAVNATCQVSVVFTPTTTGLRTGTLTLTSNGTGSPQTVALTGNGVSGPAPFQIVVRAGAQLIAGAVVQGYAAGTTGNGSAPTALFSVPLTTSSTGFATIPTTFSCPAGSPMVYVVSRGGTVAGASGANQNAVLATAVGACSGVFSGIVVNEATTVAAIEALAPFYAVGGSIGSTATNTVGLANAFATAATLADPVAGTSPGSTLPSNAVSPAKRVNSLANLLNACVVSPSACTSLYTDAPQGTTLATNTLDAAYFLAKNPTGNVAAIAALALSSSAYTPALTSVPTDWTMFINYSGGGMDSPSGIGVDSKGNVWVANYFSTASKFTPTGAAVFGSGITGSGLNNSYGLAIDLNDNVWIPNEQPSTSAGIGSVSELSSSGTSLAGNGYINGGLNYPISAAIDPNGTVWVVDYGNSHVTLLNSSGAPLSGTTGYTTPLFAFPVAVAVDANHFGWVVNQSSNNITKVAPDGSSFTNYSCCNLASGLAIDQGDNIWVANYFGNSVSLVTNSGSVVSSNYTANGAIDHPQGIAVDGAGTVWVANYRAPYLSELSGSTSQAPGTSLSSTAGIGGDANLLAAYAVALDASGNIWVSNQGSNTITKFVGLATPVKTPLSGLPQLP